MQLRAKHSSENIGILIVHMRGVNAIVLEKDVYIYIVSHQLRSVVF